jgi:hypothetical protein
MVMAAAARTRTPSLVVRTGPCSRGDRFIFAWARSRRRDVGRQPWRLGRLFPPSLFLRRSVHLRLDPQLPLGRGAASLAPRAVLPPLSMTSGWETAYPVCDPDRDALPSLRIEEIPVSKEPQEDRETTVTVMEGQISTGKINSPRIDCDRTAGTSSGLIGPPEMAWNASVSPLRPTGPFETWLPRPVSPQPCPTLEMRLPAPVSPHCLPGLLNTTMTGDVSPHIRVGKLEIVPSGHVSPRPRVGPPEMTPDDVLPIEDTGTLKMALPAPVSPQHPPGSLETAASLQTEPTRMLKVYYRKGSKARQFHDGQQDGTGRELLALENEHTTDPRPDTLTAMGAPLVATRKEEFLNKICRRPDACLLLPNKTARKQLLPLQQQSGIPQGLCRAFQAPTFSAPGGGLVRSFRVAHATSRACLKPRFLPLFFVVVLCRL